METTKDISPNHTQIPNDYLDMFMPHLSGAEWKCLCYIARRTFGFQKRADQIAFSQFENGITTKDGKVLDYGTGLSRPKISDSLQRLIEVGLLESNTRGNSKEYLLVKKLNHSEVVKKLYQTGKESLPKVVKKLNIQKKEKESIQKKDNASKLADPMSLDIFIEKCKQSNMKHIQIIGEWAEGEKPRHTTYGEWQSFIKRNLRVAKELSAYPIEKIEKAYQLLQNDVVRKLPNGKEAGFITKYSLETVIKYIDKV